MPWPDQVLMIEPEFFDVEYVINPHMESMIGSVDKNKAWVEWLALKSQFEKWGLYVHPIKGVKGLPDLVFCANQCFPMWAEDTGASFLMGAMRSPMRRSEVPYLHQVLAHKGYSIHSIFPMDQGNQPTQPMSRLRFESDGSQAVAVESDNTAVFSRVWAMFSGILNAP